MTTSYDEESMTYVKSIGCPECGEDSERPLVACPRCKTLVCCVCADDGHDDCQPPIVLTPAQQADLRERFMEQRRQIRAGELLPRDQWHRY